MIIVNQITKKEEEDALLAEYIDPNTGEIIYPESDGEPMAESTTHFQWITTIQGGLDSLFANKTDVFVAGDLFWYPVEGKPYIKVAPDIMVAFGRPKGHRSSYEQWNEGNIPPQVVIEILSKGNLAGDMIDKFIFYQKHGVQEYYIYDHIKHKFYACTRDNDKLNTEEIENKFESPLLGITFDISGEELQVTNPDNTPFLTYVQQNEERKKALLEAEEAKQREEEAKQREEEAKQREEEAKQREEEAKQREEEAKQREEEAKQREEEAKQREEEAKQREEEAFAEIEKLKMLLKDKGFNIE
jgi:Uma2 family endonuclease